MQTVIINQRELYNNARMADFVLRIANEKKYGSMVKAKQIEKDMALFMKKRGIKHGF